MPMTLVAPTPRSGGGFTDSFRITQSKHMIRVFPFKHDEKDHLAAVSVIHFIDNVPQTCTGPNCPYCAESKAIQKEAKEKGGKRPDNRMRPVTRYPMAVVDVESDPTKILRFDAPTTVYKAIYNQIKDEDPADYLGNNGIDFIIKKNAAAATPQDTYAVSPRLKGSEPLSIKDEDIPDLVDEVARDDASRVAKVTGKETPSFEEAEGEEEGQPVVTFKDSRGKKVTGKYTGKKQGGKYVVEVDGHLVRVEPKNVISGIESE